MLLRSLGAGVSGLKNFQTDLDVIGNNIANVDTSGFKKNRVNFEDIFSQQLQGPQANQNAIQVGLGSQAGSIDNIVTGGTINPTGNPYDLAINGEGYFQVTDGTGNAYYTRAGDFKKNSAGNGLVNSQGMALTINPAGQNHNTFTDLSSFTVNNQGVIQGVTTAGANVNLGQVDLFTFSNPGGLAKVGNSLLQATTASGAANGNGATNGQGTIQQNALEASNVDLTDEMTNLIEAERAYQANSKTITTADQVLQTLVNLKQ
ncbi:flagellar hook-basal body complex protein [Sporolactobacillus putidus]|uniref:Flagellar hook protein FlgE n=1 Tax=Sporolactobacillus putidus TaxID=492735 RepID=A0A917VZK5_9BACL|nr:flagellar hook-basal body complex protein [Sporolactobacillus putidus]GGL44069.1 flagellar basal-body rod protein FlgG [Sporolactobacillus putidus]